MERDILERYEKMFSRGKLLFYFGIYFGIVMLIIILKWPEFQPHPIHLTPFFKAHLWAAWVMFILSNAATLPLYLGARLLLRLHREFIKNSGIQDAAIALVNVTGHNVRQPKFRYFVTSRNLDEFESRMLRLYRELRESAIKTKHAKHSLHSTELAAQKMGELQQRFAMALSAVTNEADLDRYRNRFTRAGSLEKNRSIIRELEAKSAKSDASERSQTAKRDYFKAMLNSLASDGLCPESEALLQEAERSPYIRQSIDALKKAITLQKVANKKNESRLPEESSGSDNRPLPASQEPVLELSRFLPRAVDSEMVTQTLIIVGVDHVSYATLRLAVADLYRTNLNKRFPARSFDESLAWLVGEEILLEEWSVGEAIYHLNPKSANCASAVGERIVREVIAFRRTARVD